MPTAYQSLSIEQQVLAVGQIVYTVTSVSGVNLVQLTEDGHPIEVPTGVGELRPGPVSRSAYASIAP